MGLFVGFLWGLFGFDVVSGFVNFGASSWKERDVALVCFNLQPLKWPAVKSVREATKGVICQQNDKLCHYT